MVTPRGLGSTGPSSADARITVLLADDLLVASGLQAMIEREPDIRVVDIAIDSDDLVKKAFALRPDVVLTAFHFHSTNETVLDAIKVIHEAEADVKIIVLTHETEHTAILAAVEAGASGYVTKRQTAGDVVRAIRAATEGDIPMDPELLRTLLVAVTPVSRMAGSELTAREGAVLSLFSEGRATTDIATNLQISVHTVRNHVQHVIEKLGAHSKLEAVVIARRRGLLID